MFLYSQIYFRNSAIYCTLSYASVRSRNECFTQRETDTVLFLKQCLKFWKRLKGQLYSRVLKRDFDYCMVKLLEVKY